MNKAIKTLDDIKEEFHSFDSHLLNRLTSIDTGNCKVIYASHLIEQLSLLYYELGDYERPTLFSKKPNSGDYIKTFYDDNNKVVRAISYNFNNIILNEYYYVYNENMIKCYELDGKTLEQLEVLILKDNQESEYYRYSPLGDINTVNQYFFEDDKLMAIKQYKSSYLGDQHTEFKIKYKGDTLSEIIRCDEKSNIFPNGQEVSIFKS